MQNKTHKFNRHRSMNGTQVYKSVVGLTTGKRSLNNFLKCYDDDDADDADDDVVLYSAVTPWIVACSVRSVG